MTTAASSGELATDAGSELHVLALNSGSSSFKFGLYRVGVSGTRAIVSGQAEAIGHPNSGKFSARDHRDDSVHTESRAIPSLGDALTRMGALIAELKEPVPAAIGHRIVHGGPILRQHRLINDEVLELLHAATPFAPLHTPAALSVVRLARDLYPTLPQVACFDTAFHVGLPEIARVLPVPRELQLVGIQRYGFHGLSCESIVRQLGEDLPKRIIIAHLGNGASVTAINEGRSIDTSMGLTPTGGVMMGTRSGDLDPGVLVYLMREQKYDLAALEQLVDQRSGLLGVSGIDSDLRRLHEAAPSNNDARLAIEMFCYSVRKQMAAMIAALDGVDLIAFTGGIGENDCVVRAAICSGLSWIGIRLDGGRNQSACNPISEEGSRCSVVVLPSQENEQIARHTWTIAARGSSP